MRALPSIVRIALVGAAAATGAALVGGAPARADGAWIELNPSTIQSGYRVGIKATCEENLNQATVTSKAFGEVILAPEFGFLVGAVTVPTGTREGTYDVKLTCANGSHATTTLNVIGMAHPSYGPHTGGGGLADSGRGGPAVLATGVASVGVGLGMLAARRRRRRLA